MKCFGMLLFACCVLPTKNCQLYLGPSNIPGAGRGIIAGQQYDSLDVVEVTISIKVETEIVRSSQLNNYAYKYDKNQSVIVFGIGSLLNHDSHQSQVMFQVHPTADEVQILALESVQAGQEIFSNYGNSWLSDRNIPVAIMNTNNLLISIEDLTKFGHCLTDVEIGKSNVPFAGNGLFAKKNYSAGDIVVIAPVLTLPKYVVDKTVETSVLLNYCFTLPGNKSDVTLFPLNNAAVMNHQPEGTANLVFHWYDWTSIPSEGAYYEHFQDNVLNLAEKMNLFPENMFSASFAQFDIAFAAVTDIKEGDELTFNYGDSWTEAWNDYVLKVNNRNECVVDNVHCISKSKLLFRSYIEAPEGMFPQHWLR